MFFYCAEWDLIKFKKSFCQNDLCPNSPVVKTPPCRGGDPSSILGWGVSMCLRCFNHLIRNSLLLITWYLDKTFFISGTVRHENNISEHFKNYVLKDIIVRFFNNFCKINSIYLANYCINLSVSWNNYSFNFVMN